MKNFLFAAILTGFAGLPLLVKAQDVIEKKEKLEKVEKEEKPEKKETQEIIIRNKGDKDMKLKVEINGEDITVNGKPLAEFIDKNISINKRKMLIREGDKMMQFDFGKVRVVLILVKISIITLIGMMLSTKIETKHF